MTLPEPSLAHLPLALFAVPPGGRSLQPVAIQLGQDPAKVDMRGPFMFAEDFSYMQEVVPSCYFGLGAGPGPMLHDPGYDFNDELLVRGPAFWGRLVEKFLATA